MYFSGSKKVTGDFFCCFNQEKQEKVLHVVNVTTNNKGNLITHRIKNNSIRVVIN